MASVMQQVGTTCRQERIAVRYARPACCGVGSCYARPACFWTRLRGKSGAF